MATAATMLFDDPDTGGTDKTRAVKRVSFWRGLLEGWSGPLMMGTKPQLPSVDFSPASRVVKITIRFADGTTREEIIRPGQHGLHTSWTTSTRRVGRALQRAAWDVQKSHGIVERVATSKRLDSSGKLRDLEQVHLSIDPHGKS